jgi:hypothetical protein
MGGITPAKVSLATLSPCPLSLTQGRPGKKNFANGYLNALAEAMDAPKNRSCRDETEKVKKKKA